MQIIKKGQPNTRPTNNQICEMKVSGQLADGTIVDVNDNLSFQLGDLEVREKAAY